MLYLSNSILTTRTTLYYSRLLKITSGLGLCGRNDYELIQGNCTVKRQARFYTHTLALLSAKSDIARDPTLSEDRNTAALCNTTSRNSHTLIEDLTSSPAFKDLFSTSLVRCNQLQVITISCVY